MEERLTFYLPRESALHRFNPLTKLTTTFVLIFLAFLGPGYWLATIIFLLVIIPLSFWGKVGGDFLRNAIRLLVPVFGFLFVMQSLFYPGGRTVLAQLWFLKLTSEGIRYAYLIVSRIMVMVSSFILFLLSTHPSTLMSDLTRRGLPPTFAYVITSTLQIIPQMRRKATTIIDAQRARGLETEGKLVKRIKALVPLVRPLVFGSLVDVEERTIAIEARAFTSPLKKTFLIEISDTKLERIFRWLIILFMLLLIGVGAWYGNR